MIDEKGLERVARALCRSKQNWGDTAAVTEQYVDTFWRDYLPDAEVAITAYLSASAEPVASDMLRMIETMPDDFTDDGNCCAGKLAKEAPNV